MSFYYLCFWSNKRIAAHFSYGVELSLNFGPGPSNPSPSTILLPFEKKNYSIYATPKLIATYPDSFYDHFQIPYIIFWKFPILEHLHFFKCNFLQNWGKINHRIILLRRHVRENLKFILVKSVLSSFSIYWCDTRKLFVRMK